MGPAAGGQADGSSERGRGFSACSLGLALSPGLRCEALLGRADASWGACVPRESGATRSPSLFLGCPKPFKSSVVGLGFPPLQTETSGGHPRSWRHERGCRPCEDRGKEQQVLHPLLHRKVPADNGTRPCRLSSPSPPGRWDPK